MTQTTLASAADLCVLPFEPYRDLADRDLEERIIAVKEQM
jgi:hypothetical protein